MEVFSYGNGDFLFQIFTAVKFLMGQGSFTTLIRISILLGFLILFYQLFFTFNIAQISLGIIRQYLVVIVLFYTLFVPKVDVVIRDEIKNTNVSIANMPYGVGLFASMFTSVEKGITNLIETSFSTPDDMKFRKTGFAFSVMLMDTFKAATFMEPYVKRTVNDYIKDCFLEKSVVWGEADLAAIVESNHLWADMAPTTHSTNAPTKTYSAATPSGVITTCQISYNNISASIDAATNTSMDSLSKTMGMPQAVVSAAAQSVFLQLTNVSASATELLKQAIVMNSMKTGLAETASYAGVSSDALAYASALGEQQQRSTWAVGGELSKKYIPIIRQILEAFIYGLFPLLFVMMMFPFGTKMLHMYFVLLLWLVMWSPLYAILNLIVNTRALGVMSSIYGYYSLGTTPYLYESTNDLVAMAGYMSWMVPMLAFAVAKGSDYAMVNLASGISSSTNLTQHHSAAAATGPGGISGAATMAGHFRAAEMWGSDKVAAGGAAGSVFSAGRNIALDNKGVEAIAKTASVEVAKQFGVATGADQKTAALGFNSVDSMAASQYLNSPASQVKNVMIGSGIASEQQWGKFGLDGGSVKDVTIDQGRVTSATIQMSNGRGNVEISGGMARVQGVIDSGNIQERSADAQAAGLSRIEQNLAPGQQFNGVYGKDGNLVQATISSGGQMSVSDSVDKNQSSTGRMTTDNLSIKGQGGEEVHLSNAHVVSLGGQHTAVGQTQDGSFAAYSISSAQGISGDSHNAQISGTVQKGSEERGMKSDTVLTPAETKQLAQQARDAGDSYAAKQLDTLAAQGKDVHVSQNAAVFSHAYASIDAKSGASAKSGDIGSRQEVSESTKRLNLSGSDALKIADQAEHSAKAGGGKHLQNFADGVRAMVKEHGGAHFDIQSTQEGKMTSVRAEAGGKSTSVDHRSSQKGWESFVQGISKGEFGSQFTSKDINEKQVSHGTVYSNPQTVLQMVNNADKSFIAPATHASTVASRDSQIKNAAAQLAGAQASFATSQGKNAHTAIAGAFLSAGLGTPSVSPVQARAGVDGRISIESRFEANYNTMTQANQQALSTAIKQGEGLKLTGDKLDTYVANKMQEYNQAFHQNVDKEQGFGAARPGELIRQATEKLSSGNKNEDASASFDFVGP